MEIIGTFFEKELQNTNLKYFKVENVINREGDKLYVKWKCCDNSFHSWIDKKECKIVSMTEYFPEPKSSGGRVKT